MSKPHAFLGLSVILCASAVHAQHSVRVSAEVERIENPLLLSASPGGVTVLRLEPEYTYEVQDARTRSRLSLGAVLESSSDTALLASRTYPSLGYTWTHGWPTSSLELRASLAESATRNTEFEELGRVTVDSRERSLLAGARWSQELTARTQLVLDVTNARVSYDPSLLPDYRELEVSGQVSWEASERLSYYLEPSYARLDISGAVADLTQNRWLAGVRSELTPAWSLAAFAGQVRTRGSESSTDGVGGFRLAYAGSRLSSGLEWSRDVTVSVSDAAYVRADALTMRLGFRVSESATLSASVARSDSEGVGGSRGQVSALSLENELAPNWSATLGVEDRRSRPDSTGETAKGWAVRAGLVYVYPGR
ncbi:MAG: hypothetical protein EP308_00445 [Burkholderiales bacterium]|nr:MAG: hypothetical protein EP308_00445 [Burkholderiales bacterium]